VSSTSAVPSGRTACTFSLKVLRTVICCWCAMPIIVRSTVEASS